MANWVLYVNILDAALRLQDLVRARFWELEHLFPLVIEALKQLFLQIEPTTREDFLIWGNNAKGCYMSEGGSSLVTVPR